VYPAALEHDGHLTPVKTVVALDYVAVSTGHVIAIPLRAVLGLHACLQLTQRDVADLIPRHENWRIAGYERPGHNDIDAGDNRKNRRQQDVLQHTDIMTQTLPRLLLREHLRTLGQPSLTLVGTP
jgi:hypothetical protein